MFAQTRFNLWRTQNADRYTRLGNLLRQGLHAQWEKMEHKRLHPRLAVQSPRCRHQDRQEQNQGITGEENIRKALNAIDWTQSALLCHNTAFDGAILAWRYGIIPAFYYDTLSMTRGLHNEVSRASFETIMELYEVGHKSKTHLTPTYGKRDLSPEVLKGLGEGCIIDVDGCYDIFRNRSKVFPEKELALIDLTLRMFIQPVFQINKEVAEKALAEELAERTWLIAASGVDEKTLTSNPVRCCTGEAWRFVSDEGQQDNWRRDVRSSANRRRIRELLDHDDRRVVRLAAGRLAAKSTLFETRGRRLIEDGTEGLRLPVLLNYFGAKLADGVEETRRICRTFPTRKGLRWKHYREGYGDASTQCRSSGRACHCCRRLGSN